MEKAGAVVNALVNACAAAAVSAGVVLRFLKNGDKTMQDVLEMMRNQTNIQ